MRSKTRAGIKLPAKASIYYLGASIIGKGVGMIATPFLTRLMSAEDYGNFALYITVLGAGSVICSAVNTGSGVYSGLAHNSSKKNEYTKALIIASISFSGVIYLLLLTFCVFLGLNRVFLLPLLIQLICDSIVAVTYSKARYEYRYLEVAVLSILSAVLPPTLSVIILRNIGGGYRVRIYSLLVVSLAISIYSVIRILSQEGKATREMTKEAITHALPLLPHSLSTALMAQSDKLIITSLLGTSALAEYSVAYSLGGATLFLSGAIGSALNPWIIRRIKAGEGRRVGELFGLMLTITSAAVLFLVGISPEVMRILAPKEYYDAISAVLPISLSTLPSFIISTATVGLVYDGRSKYTAYVSLISASSCIIFNYMLCPALGYSGAGVSLLLSQVLGAAIAVYYLKKQGLEEIIGLRKSTITLLRAALIGICLILPREYAWVRALLLIFPAITALNALLVVKRLVTEKVLSN